MKKINVLLLVAFFSPHVFFSAQAFIAKQTFTQVVDQIAEYEELCAQEKAKLHDALFALDRHTITALSKNGQAVRFYVREESLLAIQPFIKKNKNPLFGDWIIQAIDSEDDKLVRFLVRELGADINFMAENGKSALYCAVERQGVDGVRMVNCLLHLGADTEQLAYAECVFDRCTPLGLVTHSVVYGKERLCPRQKIELLLKHGAHLDVVDDEGNDFFQRLENCYGQLSADGMESSARVLHAARERMAKIRELPAVIQAMDRLVDNGMPRQKQEVEKFLPGEQGIADLVIDYASSTALVEHREQRRIERNRDRVLAQVPNLADLVGDYLPWELEEEDGQDGEIESGLSEKVDEQESKSEDTGN